MLPALLLTLSTQTPVQTPAVAMDFRDGFFILTEPGGEVTKVNSRIWPKAHPTAFELKHPNATLAWSGRGLSVTVGPSVRTARFAEMTASPKFLSRTEIDEIARKVTAGSVVREVSSLAGWEQVGDMLYMLVRWEDKAKKPWLEGLIRVDLSKKSPWYEALAVTRTISDATGPVDDQLYPTANGLYSLATTSDSWGINNYSAGAFKFTPVGRFPKRAEISADSKLIRVVEKTNYGMNLVASVTAPAGVRTNLFETRGEVSFPGDDITLVAVVSSSSTVVRNTTSGLELELPKDVGLRSVRAGLLVWVPAKDPRQAVLYNRDSLRSISRWTAPTKPTQGSGTGKPTKPPAKP